MGWRPAQDIDEGLLGVLPPVESAEQNRALDLGIDGIIAGAPMRQQVFQLRQSGFLRQPGSPAARATGSVPRGSHALCQSGHDAYRFAIGELSIAPLSADSHHGSGISTMPIGASIAKYFPLPRATQPEAKLLAPAGPNPASARFCLP
jgi:hypothetical protein